MKAYTIFLLLFCMTVSLFGGDVDNDKFTLAPSAAFTVSILESKPKMPVCLYGKAWQDYSRGLVTFNFKEINPARFARISKAELILRLGKCDNPQQLPLLVSMINTEWNDQVSWNSSGMQKWPEKDKLSNIDYAADPSRSISVPLAASGELRIDITRIADAWMFQGLQNYGLLMSIGKTISGKPDAGNWAVMIEDAKLELTFAGPPPIPASQPERTIRYYPSAFLPPVREPYVFHLFNGSPTRHASSVINSFNSKARPEQGKLPLTWCFGPNDPYKKTENQFLDSYLGLSKNKIGIEVDEWQGIKRLGENIATGDDPNKVENNLKIEWSIKGILAAKAANPSFYTAVYWRGEDSIVPLTEKGFPDLLIIEGQSHLNKKYPISFGVDLPAVGKRINYARELGMIERTIVLIGFFEEKENYHPSKILTIQEVDKILRYCRENGPEMPGIAFYGGNGHELLRQTEALCYEYYIKPSPEIKITCPAYNTEISSMHVEIKVDAQAQDGRKIQRYEWFIDNRFVAKTQEPFWIWDAREVSDGQHFITVHAIDSNWYRAAAQLPVRVKLNN